MGRAIRLVPALVATLLVAAAPAFASGSGPPPTAPGPTTTLAGTGAGAHCGATIGPGARWLRTSAPCEVALTRGATARLTLSARYRYGPLASGSAHVAVTTLNHPTSGGLTGTLRGRSLGTARVSALASAVCPSGVACPMYVLLWSIQVAVVPPPASLTLTQADNGRTVTLARGQRLVVALTGPSAYTWTTPVAARPAVLTRLSGSAGHATFAAAGAGTTTVSATDNPNCYPACLPPSYLFRVTVVVR